MQTEDAHFSELRESRREPTREELAELMRRYLGGVVDDAAVARLYGQFREVVADPVRRAAEESAFRANAPRYVGQAWKELLSPHNHIPAPVELALWLAIISGGYPAPRLFCPSEIAGDWKQHEPGEASWTLASDGAFSTTDLQIASGRVVRWCVHFVARRSDLQGDQLWLIDAARHTYSPKIFIILEYTGRQLRLLRPGGDFGDVVYRLARSAD